MKPEIINDRIIEAAAEIFNETIRYNYRFTMEKAIEIATKQAVAIQMASRDSSLQVNSNGVIHRFYDYGNITSIDSVYGHHGYCGD